VPRDNDANKLSSEALDAFLNGILDDLRNPPDPEILNEVRAVFRRRIPLALRSYAAALLILRAAGLSRAGNPKTERREQGTKGTAINKGRQKTIDKKPLYQKSQLATSGAEERPAPRPRFSGEAVTLFFSMGKRQRLYPRILIDLIVDTAKLTIDSIGDVRVFDNYSFVDIDPQKVSTVITSLDGSEFRGRRLSVGPAKKRDVQET
jgi:hypothetical protein